MRIFPTLCSRAILSMKNFCVSEAIIKTTPPESGWIRAVARVMSREL